MLDVPEKTKKDSFRPLSGSYISQFSVLIAILQNTLVSVPYRGATFLNIDRTFLMLQAQFPSPIGELHFSIKIFSFVSRSQRCFRPLSGSYISQLRLQVVSHGVTLVSVPYRGATFLNNRRTCSAKAVWKPFPSPIGELHFSIVHYLCWSNEHEKVSVPYRGATFLNTIPATPCPVWDE